MTAHIEMSENICDLIGALTAAQAGMETIRKEKENPQFKSKYATLSAVLEAVSPALSANGIALLQPISTGEAGEAVITTMIVHKSGQYIRSTVAIKPAQNTPQSFGSAVSYGRRYGVLAMLGVSPDDDDDGNAASIPPPSKKLAAQKQPPVTDHVDAAAYVAEWQTYIANAETEQEIRNTWKREKPQRDAAGISEMQLSIMMNAMKARFAEIRDAANILMAG